MIDVTDSNVVYYYHFDGLGSVVALSNNNGNIVERYSYDVFGEPNRVSDVNNPYLFTGRRYDSETGLYYYRARYYNPGIGRFMSSDPLGIVPDGGRKNSFAPLMQYESGMNLYTYVGNSPVNYVDPLGLKWRPPKTCEEICDDKYQRCGTKCVSELTCDWNLPKWGVCQVVCIIKAYNCRTDCTAEGW